MTVTSDSHFLPTGEAAGVAFDRFHVGFVAEEFAAALVEGEIELFDQGGEVGREGEIGDCH